MSRSCSTLISHLFWQLHQHWKSIDLFCYYVFLVLKDFVFAALCLAYHCFDLLFSCRHCKTGWEVHSSKWFPLHFVVTFFFFKLDKWIHVRTVCWNLFLLFYKIIRSAASTVWLNSWNNKSRLESYTRRVRVRFCQMLRQISATSTRPHWETMSV